jgi:hypothetical protein
LRRNPAPSGTDRFFTKPSIMNLSYRFRAWVARNFWKRACPLPLLKYHRGIRDFSAPAGRGDSGALRGTTRRWSFHGPGRGRRPSASLFGNPLVLQIKARFPAGASAKRAAAPAPKPSSHPKNEG